MATDRKLGIIEVKNLVYGYGYISESNTKIGMMENNSHLQSVDCNFPVLKDGTNMFKNCTSLQSFKCDDLSHSFMFASLFIEIKHSLGFACINSCKLIIFTESNSFL